MPAETMDQPVESTNSIDDNPNLVHKRIRLHIVILAADMEYGLLLTVAIRLEVLVEVFYLALQLRNRPIVSLTFYILTWDNYYIG